jgi:hypothetical protein
MDDATSEHYSMFFVKEEGTASSFNGLGNRRASIVYILGYSDSTAHLERPLDFRKSAHLETGVCHERTGKDARIPWRGGSGGQATAAGLCHIPD